MSLLLGSILANIFLAESEKPVFLYLKTELNYRKGTLMIQFLSLKLKLLIVSYQFQVIFIQTKNSL